ncbi:hypothetical protein N7481_000196 [Penicillium waksmanii]|uniref:uncharacterized protein n=1 Tax=Penicillium waksmanii TaxID=69791 RepID=UPI002546EAD5|nr:uncharacterized protein N7481_000196 [Penicillium waksmanii]KAJ5999787.1 hypothetical protein N7481_000196 [Penicillium waksmanii]
MDIESAVSGEKEKVLNADDAQLLAMGKKPELQRVYNTWTLCAYQVMISASWSCLIVLYSTIFDVGGPAGLIWATWLPGVNLFGAIWVVGGGVAWAIVFIVMAPKHDAKIIFTEFLNNTGYENTGWVFIMSFYNSIYGLVGTDGMMHLVEEMKNPAKNAPRSMIYSMILCGIMSWLAAVLMIWTAGDWTTYMPSPQPYMSWWIGVTGSLYGGGLFCALVMIGINFFVIVGTNSAGSRIVWSMARDKAFPYSEYLARVNPRLGIPLRAIGFVVVVDLILGLIVLGSDLAFQSIISGGGLMLQVSYLVPVLIVLVRGRKILPPRPHFDLGKWGYVINIFSVGLYWIFGARFRYIKEQNSVMEDNVVVIDGVVLGGLEAIRRGEGAQVAPTKE